MNLVRWAVGMTWRRRRRHALVAGVLALTVGSLTSVLLVASALEHSLLAGSDALPELTLQRLRGGRPTPVPIAWAEELSLWPGVAHARTRVWGYAWLPPAQVTLTLVGLDPALPGASADLDTLLPSGTAQLQAEEDVLLGPAVADVLRRQGLDHLELREPSGHTRRLTPRGVLPPEIGLWAADAVLMQDSLARALLGYGAEWGTDLVLRVPNPSEVAPLAARLQARHPDARVLTRAQQQASTRAAFAWREGWILLAGLLLLLATLVLVLVQGSALDEAEREELAVLRATGWTAAEVLALKGYEGLMVSGLGVLAGLGMALLHVHFLGGAGVVSLLGGHAALRPGLVLTGPYDPWPALAVSLVSLLAVGLAGLLPAFRLAMRDPAEVLR